MDRFKIRAASPSDAKDICAMAAELSAHEGQPDPPFDTSQFKRFGFGKEQRFFSLVADFKKSLIGYVLFCDSFHVGTGTPGLLMLDLFVKRNYRSMGVARSLMACLSKECMNRGGTWVTWQCQPGNEIALEFYQKLGGRRFAAIDFELAGAALKKLANGNQEFPC